MTVDHNIVTRNDCKKHWALGYKLFFRSTQVSSKFIMLINVKMPTIVGISTFISVTNTTSERLKARNLLICQYFSFDEKLKFRAQLSSVVISYYQVLVYL